jgi:hypothetical protein
VSWLVAKTRKKCFIRVEVLHSSRCNVFVGLALFRLPFWCPEPCLFWVTIFRHIAGDSEIDAGHYWKGLLSKRRAQDMRSQMHEKALLSFIAVMPFGT